MASKCGTQGCRGGCYGCRGSCSGNSTKTDSCGGGCYASCSNSVCQGSCRGGCNTSCSGSCKGGCNTTCSGSCKGGCNTTCTGSCSGGCNTTCTGNCSGSCSGCTGSCSGSCSGCTGSCNNLCNTGCTNTAQQNAYNTIMAFSDILYANEVNVLRDFIAYEVNRRSVTPDTVANVSSGTIVDDAWWTAIRANLSKILTVNANSAATAGGIITKTIRNSLRDDAVTAYNTMIGRP